MRREFRNLIFAVQFDPGQTGLEATKHFFRIINSTLSDT